MGKKVLTVTPLAHDYPFSLTGMDMNISAPFLRTMILLSSLLISYSSLFSLRGLT